MKFYDRRFELQILETINEQARAGARMVVITGRRRVGKTLLSLEFIKNKPHLYLFVSKKSEPLLCQEYVRQIRDQLAIPVIGEITRIRDLLQLLLEASRHRPFVLVMDEVQELHNINPSLFSDLQNLWDQHKATSQITLLFLGSIYSLMTKIFEDAKEPLFGRADRILHLQPFSIATLAKILRDHGQESLSTLFNYYMLTGGAPKYVDLLITNSVFSFEEIIAFMVSEHSPFLAEGKNLLVEEFGREYATYFSILELISEGKTSRSEIESILQRDVGGYLDRLERDYALIKRVKPINTKPGSKLLKYRLHDHFLRFWFRFIYRHRTAVETGNYCYIQDAIHRNIASYGGPLLEQFFHDLFAASGQYNQIGAYWERDHTNEIDLVAVNDAEKRVVIAEIKRNKDKIRISHLREKATRLIQSYRGYEIEFHALSLDDAQSFLSLENDM